MVKLQTYYITNTKKHISNLVSDNKKLFNNLNTAKVNITTKGMIITTLKSEKTKTITQHEALNKKY